MGFKRQRQRFVAHIVFGVLSFGGKQHSAFAVDHGLAEVAIFLRKIERQQCCVPVLLFALLLEERVRRPSKFRIGLEGTTRKLARCFALAFALGFEEQSAQAELLGFRRSKHGFINTPRRRAIAGQLGRLRAQEVGQWFMRKRFPRLQSVSAMTEPRRPPQQRSGRSTTPRGPSSGGA